ncbi:STAS domain-containing protein [Rhodoferax sp. UBA5149]|uniref:STAS domain-containing protein n=1 Tax=Rhodoferax sp. UBA5149 TaxID=1947379 RepID=UPI0025E91E9B|nr:STAS domain-containing protein [Rhodoferax sp. UBA5149]
MATKDNNAGLLSKMARFVRNPTKDWSELDKPEPEQESGYSKLALKEMIERKRQNDFVRRREFDQLRKLRRNASSIRPDLAGRPSFFQTSTASNLGERAMTLKKIDDIEAQMSKQWWKGKHDETSVQGDNFPVAADPALAPPGGAPTSGAPRDKTGAFARTEASELNPDTDSSRSADYETTQMGVSTLSGPESMGGAGQVMVAKNTRSRNFDSGIGEFSTSKLFSIELGDSLSDPDLEEAAIRFANGDDAGAEAGLLAALQADNVDPNAADGWAAALFDLYRGTGQQASFDRVAIEFAERFGRSAPAWFSTPDLLGRKADASPSDRMAAPSSHTVWECPAELDWQAVQVLRAILSRTAPPWHLHWNRLGSITPDAAQALADLFAEWCAQPVKLYFAGADVLEKTLRSCTPSGDKRVESFWWRLRLDALRILRLQDEFELAALDYCVIYEVSPPPWADARCEFVHEQLTASMPLETSRGVPGDVSRAVDTDFSQAPTVLMGLDAITTPVVELTGEVLGDAAEALDKLQAGLKGSDRLVISCARLIRVDFSAAGSILNWVAVRESEGCHVQFRDVPRLVAAFFNVIGINEHARVVLRTS